MLLEAAVESIAEDEENPAEADSDTCIKTTSQQAQQDCAAMKHEF